MRALPQPSRRDLAGITYPLLLVLIAVLMSAYFVARYHLGWAETDTALLTRATGTIAADGTLAPDSGLRYTNGYAYQAILLFLSEVSGLSIITLQRWALPFALAAIPLIFWMVAYEVTRSRRAAAIGTILLLVQPELMFVALRGSHEKFGRALMLLSLFLLFKTLRGGGAPRRILLLISLFYMTLFAYMASNFLLAFSYLAALAFALAVGWLLAKLLPARTGPVSSHARLLPAIGSAFILAYLLAFAAYPPVQDTILVVDTLLERMKLLLLNPEGSVDVYQKAFNAWGSPLAYLTFNLSNWLVLLGSFAIWIKTGWSFLRGDPAAGEEGKVRWLLWLLYGAFGLQALLSVVSDASGMFGNLQHRIFPSLSILGVLVITVWVKDRHTAKTAGRERGEGVRDKGGVAWRVAACAGVFGLALLSTLKFTNEPALVGWWVFTTPGERAALEWASERLPEASLWVGHHERLYELNRMEGFFPSTRPKLDFRAMEAGTSYSLISPGITAYGTRFRQALPDVNGWLRIYDNGEACVYKRRPASVYQK